MPWIKCDACKTRFPFVGKLAVDACPKCGAPWAADAMTAKSAEGAEVLDPESPEGKAVLATRDAGTKTPPAEEAKPRYVSQKERHTRRNARAEERWAIVKTLIPVPEGASILFRVVAWWQRERAYFKLGLLDWLTFTAATMKLRQNDEAAMQLIAGLRADLEATLQELRDVKQVATTARQGAMQLTRSLRAHEANIPAMARVAKRLKDRDAAVAKAQEDPTRCTCGHVKASHFAKAGNVVMQPCHAANCKCEQYTPRVVIEDGKGPEPKAGIGGLGDSPNEGSEVTDEELSGLPAPLIVMDEEGPVPDAIERAAQGEG